MTKKNSTYKAKRPMTAEEFDRHFDEGGEILSMMDLAKAHSPGQDIKRVNVDFPPWIVGSLDQHATRMGVTRQSVIKVWIAERLQQEDRVRVPQEPAAPYRTH